MDIALLQSWPLTTTARMRTRDNRSRRTCGDLADVADADDVVGIVRRRKKKLKLNSETGRKHLVAWQAT